MKKLLDPLRKNTIFDKKKFILYWFLTFISILFIATFPLITQFYLHIAYSKELSFLFYSTIIIVLIYVGRIFIEAKAEKLENKYFLKLESNLQESLFKKYFDNKKSFYFLHDILERKVSLYLLFVRKVVFENSKEIMKILIIFIIILFFQKKLFIYSLIFLPIFALYGYLFMKAFRKNEKITGKLNSQKDDSDFTNFLYTYSNQDIAWKDYKKFQSINLEKELRNRTSLTTLNNFLYGSLWIFRILYLAYFGYFVITTNLSITGLIVGLLFIIMLASSFSNLLKNIQFYFITKSSFDKINRLLEANSSYKDKTIP